MTYITGGKTLLTFFEYNKILWGWHSPIK